MLQGRQYLQPTFRLLLYSFQKLFCSKAECNIGWMIIQGKTLDEYFKGALSGLKQFLATESSLKMMKNAFSFTLKVPSCKLYNKKYMIVSTQITDTETFTFIVVLVVKLLIRKVLFINRKDNRNC